MSLHLIAKQAPESDVASQHPPETSQTKPLLVMDDVPWRESPPPQQATNPPAVDSVGAARLPLEARSRIKPVYAVVVDTGAPLRNPPPPPLWLQEVAVQPLHAAPVIIPQPPPELPLAKHLKRRRLLSTPASIAMATLLAVSSLALWGILYGSLFSGIQEQRAQRVLYARVREQLALQTSPVGGHIKPGAPVGVIQIPELGLHNLVFVEGTSASLLEAGPGHRPDTPLPGEAGASFLMGRSQTFGGPFARIGSLKAGDGIAVETGEGVFQFTVDGVRRSGDPQHLLPHDAARITLVSSADGVNARETIFVDATTATNVQTPSAGRPGSLPVAETYMKGDLRALGPLVLWLLALVVAVLGSAWLLTKWRLKPTLLVGIPVVIALLWGIVDVASRLLPNLI